MASFPDRVDHLLRSSENENADSPADHYADFPAPTPKFDIAQECQFEASSKDEMDRCVTDETQTREQLQTEWTQFAPSAKPSAKRRGRHFQLCRIAGLPRNGERCEEAGRWEDVKVALPVVRGLHGSRTEGTTLRFKVGDF